jgi:flagellar biosynthesis/type III secretory pathway protein FliH
MEPIIRAAAIAPTTHRLRRSVTGVGAEQQNEGRGGQQPQQNRPAQTPPAQTPPQMAGGMPPPNFGNRTYPGQTQTTGQTQTPPQTQTSAQTQTSPQTQTSAQPSTQTSAQPSTQTPLSTKAFAPHPPAASASAQAATDESAKVYEAALAQLAKEQQQQQTAQNLILQKQREAELVEAKKAAERLGYAEGLTQGKSAAQKSLTEQVAQLAVLMEEVYAARQEVVNGAEDMIVDIVFQSICRILGESADQRVMVTGMVQQVLKQFRQQEPLVLLLHPQDMALVQQNLPEMGIDPEQTQFRTDASLKIGGCLVESMVGTLDARLETQLSRLRDALLQARRGDERGDEYTGAAL